MKPAKKNYQDPFVGYFASVAIALFVSGWLAELLIGQFSGLLPVTAIEGLTINIAAGLFLAIAFSNLIGTAIRRGSLRNSAIRFVLGFCSGMIIQDTVFTPVAGHGMSNFLFLLVAGAAVPVVFAARWLGASMGGHSESWANKTLKVLSASDRVIFVTLMMVSSLLFWMCTNNTNQLLAGLAAVLGILVLSVSLNKGAGEADDPEEAELLAWLALEPEDDLGAGDQMIQRFKYVVQSLLPGAVLFGGMIRLGVDFMVAFFPNIHASFYAPMETAQTLGIIAASGLAVIFFGMLGALGFGLASLQLVGRISKWSPERLHKKSFSLIRLMYLRPLRKG